MPYEWDPDKNASNVRKHGIAFDDAIEIFNGLFDERIDDTQIYGEERWIAVGEIRGREITIIYTPRPRGRRRIISARKATPSEREAYWQWRTTQD